MENDLYKLMIYNAKVYLKDNANEITGVRPNIFGISTVLAICTEVSKERIAEDIIEQEI